MRRSEEYTVCELLTSGFRKHFTIQIGYGVTILKYEIGNPCPMWHVRTAVISNKMTFHENYQILLWARDDPWANLQNDNFHITDQQAKHSFSEVHLCPTIDIVLPICIRCSSQLLMKSSALPSSIVLRQLSSVLFNSSGFRTAHELHKTRKCELSFRNWTNTFHL